MLKPTHPMLASLQGGHSRCGFGAAFTPLIAHWMLILPHRMASASSALYVCVWLKYGRSRLCHYQERSSFSSGLLCQFCCMGLYLDCAWQHLGPLSTCHMSCLGRICGVSRMPHVPIVEILSSCHTLSVEEQEALMVWSRVLDASHPLVQEGVIWTRQRQKCCWSVWINVWLSDARV